jgi:hypothetical protein
MWEEIFVRKQLLVFMCALGMGTNLAFCANSETSRNLIGQNWYCTDNYQGVHRYIFNANGTFTEAFFTSTPKNHKYWDQGGGKATGYTIVSPSQIRILDSSFNPPFFTVHSLSPRQLTFDHRDTSYICSHIPPPGDTLANAAAVASETAQGMEKGKRFFTGKWITRDRLQSAEFFPDGSCVITSHVTGSMDIDITMYKGTVRGKSSISSDGNGIDCAGEVSFGRTGPNRIDYSVQHESISLYRGSANALKPAGALTQEVAQKVLNQQIDQSTANNTLLTCHACYNFDDKADNDSAVIVSTYSPSMTQFLIEHGYVRGYGDQQVFTAKAKRSRYYNYNDGGPGLRFANFRSPRILTSRITDPKHVPIEYDLVPTEITASFFNGVQHIKSNASFSLEDGAWEVCIACRQ